MQLQCRSEFRTVVALCISVVSFPLMLDRHAGAGDATVTSLRAVARNPITMAAWGLIVAVLPVAGSPPSARAALRGGFPGRLVSMASQGRRISYSQRLRICRAAG